MIRNHNGYWNIKSNRELLAKTCNTRNEYSMKNSAAYKKSLKENEIEEFALKFKWKKCGNKYKRLIYAFIFENEKIVYIGLTCDEKRRFNEHTKFDKTSPIFKFNKKYKYLILTDYLPILDATKLEAYYMDYYLELGYTLLCKRSNAGNLGSNKIIWNYIKRENAAKLCTSKTEYSNKYGRAYYISIKLKEIDDFALKFNWIKNKEKNKFWQSKENRENVAIKCKSLSEYSNQYSSAYNVSKQKYEIEEFRIKFNWKSKQKPSGYWTNKENRENVASQCKTKTEYKNKYNGAYSKSRILHELDELSKKYNW